MTSRADIEEFFQSKEYAVVGVSADRRKFGNAVFRTMKEKGFTVYPVHPVSETVEGVKCYRSVTDLPSAVESIVTVVPPAITENAIQEGIAKNVRHIWMQPGSVSKGAAKTAREAGATVVEGECILMFLEPVESIHALHRWIKKLLGRYPAR